MEQASVDQLLQQAKMHILKGELTKANAIYESVLKFASGAVPIPLSSEGDGILIETSSEAPPAGSIEQLSKLYNRREFLVVLDEATALLKQYPSNLVIWNLLGASATEIGQLDHAVSAFLRVIEINPNHAQAYNNLGTAYFRKEELNLAIEAYKKAISINSHYPDALNNLGQALCKIGSVNEAIEAYRTAVSIKPTFAPAYFNLGLAFKISENWVEAIDAFEKAVFLNSDFKSAYNEIGLAFLGQCDVEQAVTYLKKAVSLHPECAFTHNNLGFALHKIGAFQEAAFHFKTAISLKPDHVEAMSNLGAALKEQEKFDQAMELYNEAITLNPRYSDAHNNLGDLYREQGYYEKALTAFKIAISLNPNCARAYNNLGATYKNLGRFDEAAQAFKSAIEVEPKFADSYHNLGRLYWLMCNFKKAFELMEWRWLIDGKSIGDVYSSVKPVWNGEYGAKVFVWKEQGLGDQIMYASMLSEVSEKSKGLVVECDERLRPIYERSFPKDIKFINNQNNISELDYDHQIAIGSLPKHLRKNLEDFTYVANGWLKADPHRKNDLRKKLLRNERDRIIGISWFTKSTLKEARKRNIPLVELMESLKQVPATFVSLQYGDTADELRTVSDQLDIEIVNVNDIDFNKDIDGLAALISACDVVVSIDNTTVHLAGALGVDTRVLLSNVAEERWGTSGLDSYWYEALHIYRRGEQKDWKSQLNQLTDDLFHLCS